MAAFSTVAMLIAGGLGAAGSIGQGRSAKAQADFQARVNDQQALREKQVSAEEEKDFRRVQSSNFAERRAAMGASGIDLSSGSPLLASEEFAAEAELQARRIRAGGEVKSLRSEQEAGLLRMAGKSAQRQGVVRGGASLLSGFAKAYG